MLQPQSGKLTLHGRRGGNPAEQSLSGEEKGRVLTVNYSQSRVPPEAFWDGGDVRESQTGSIFFRAFGPALKEGVHGTPYKSCGPQYCHPGPRSAACHPELGPR